MQDESMYEYDTPEGYSDIFFVYVFDANAAGLVNGSTANFQGIPVTDGGFVCRAWNGAYTILNQVAGALGQIEIYGQNLDKWYDTPVKVYTLNPTGQCAAVAPAKEYPTNGNIRFDLVNVNVRMV